MVGDTTPEVMNLTDRADDPEHPKRILVTNDDGIDSAGMQALATELAHQHEVIVAAPATNFSGSGTGIGRFSPRLGVEISSVDGFNHSSQAIAGPPGLAVMAAALGAFGDIPDLVVSGPNAGMNTGHSIIHSGTVGAVLGARTFGISGVALSLAYSDPWHWDSAVAAGVQIVDWILDRGDAILTLNVNIPALPIDQLKSARWARLDDFGYFHVADADLENQLLHFDVGGSRAGTDPECDTAICRSGHVSITPLVGVEEAPVPAVDAAELAGF